jgi:hypothetical protein
MARTLAWDAARWDRRHLTAGLLAEFAEGTYCL